MDLDQPDTNNVAATTITTAAVEDIPPVAAPAVPAVSSSTVSLDDTFDALAKRQGGFSNTAAHRRRRPKGPKLQIVLSNAATEATATATAQVKQKAASSPTRRRMESKAVEAPPESFNDQDDGVDVNAWDTTDNYMREEMEQELEDSLRFFQETHEDQDASYCLLQKELDQEARKRKIKELSELDKKGRQEIDDVINEQMKERQTATEKSVERYRQRLTQDEKRDTVRLNLLLHQKSPPIKDQSRIKILQSSAKELQSALQQHRQQNQYFPSMANLNGSPTADPGYSSNTQLQEFGGKGDELKENGKDFKRNKKS
jgi:hypothetical protein